MSAAPRASWPAAEHDHTLALARLAAIVESAEDAIISESLEGIIETWNPAAERMYGYSAAEAIGRSMAMLLPRDRADELPRLLEKARRGEHVAQLETSRARKDGSLVDVCLTVSPIRAPDGAVVGASVVTRDATERRQAERALRRSEQRYRSLVEACTEIVWCTDAEGNCVGSRPSWEAYTGQRFEEYQGWGWLRMFHADDRHRVQEAWSDATKTPSLTTLEVRLWHAASARHRHCIARAVPLCNAHLWEWSGTITDVDDRRRAERAARFLSDATALLAGSLDYRLTLDELARLCAPALADACVVSVIEEGGLRRIAATYCDPEASAGTSEEARHARAEELLDDTASVVRTGHTHLAAGEARPRLCVPMRARGQTLGAICFVFADRVARRFEPDDVALCEELGRRAGLAVDNARMYALAQQSARAREEFLTVASHELRTPLVPLKLAIDALLKEARTSAGEATPKRTARLLSSVERSAARLVARVDELLDVTRLSAEQLTLQLEPVDLAALVEDVLARSAPTLAAAGCEPRVEVRGPAKGRWDRTWLEKALAYLLSNATKYGRGHPIAVCVEGDGGWARLSVRDHGFGISPAEQARIFDRFERVVSARHFGGFGLGLWSVRRIAEAHGGFVRVESMPDDGATFTITLPRRGADG